MPWCPECKSEYEQGVTECAECHVPLVDDEENAVAMRPLIKVKRADLDELLEYLDYSSITERTLEEDNEGVLIYVSENQIADAAAYLKVYVREHMSDEEEEDNYFFDAYETENLDVKGKADEMRSSAVVLWILGGGLLMLAVLNFMDILPLPMFNKTVFTIAASFLGGMFVVMAVHSQKRIAGILDSGAGKTDQVDMMVNDYMDSGKVDKLKKKLGPKLKDLDEGAAYFAVMDAIKGELEKAYPEAANTLVNVAAEKIHEAIEEDLY